MPTSSVAELKGTLAAFAAALLFGVSAPFAKLLVAATGPLMLAALLYLGAGLGLALVSLFDARPRAADATLREAPLRGADWMLLVAIVAVGGVSAPVLMLFGLAHELLEHEHAHVHDEHHRHEHREGDRGQEPHAHLHAHLPLSHAHPHMSEIHHRHRH